MAAITKHPRAGEDLSEIWDYIADDSVAHADAFIDVSTQSSASWLRNR